jgi:hypothetical protein
MRVNHEENDYVAPDMGLAGVKLPAPEPRKNPTCLEAELLIFKFD